MQEIEKMANALLDTVKTMSAKFKEQDYKIEALKGRCRLLEDEVALLTNKLKKQKNLH